MDSLKSAIPRRTRLASVPLIISFGALPLGAVAVRAVGGELGAVSVLMPWLLLAAVGVLMSMRGTSKAVDWKKLSYRLPMFLVLVLVLLLYQADLRALVEPYLPYLAESSPLIFLLFSLLWASTCGLPDRGDFQRFGALLGTLCVFDLAVELPLYETAPAMRWIGNADVLAGLLLVALCAGLKPGGNEGGLNEPDQGHPIWRGLVLVGVLACLSRTGLFAAGWVVLCFGRGKVRWRLLYAVVCAALIYLTFLLPPTPSDAVRYSNYWLWVEALRIFSHAPDLLTSGFPITGALPIEFPPEMAAIWQAATGKSSQLGAFLPDVPSFWLRLTMAWGVFAPLGLLGVIFILLLRRISRLGAGLTAALFAQGMTTPLLYDPAMAVTITLAFILALSGRKKANHDPVAERNPRPNPTR